MSCKFLIPLLTAVFLAAPAFAPVTTMGLSSSALAETSVKSSKSTPATVLSTAANRTPANVLLKVANQTPANVLSKVANQTPANVRSHLAETSLRERTKNSGHATEK